MSTLTALRATAAGLLLAAAWTAASGPIRGSPGQAAAATSQSCGLPVRDALVPPKEPHTVTLDGETHAVYVSSRTGHVFAVSGASVRRRQNPGNCAATMFDSRTGVFLRALAIPHERQAAIDDRTNRLFLLTGGITRTRFSQVVAVDTRTGRIVERRRLRGIADDIVAYGRRDRILVTTLTGCSYVLGHCSSLTYVLNARSGAPLRSYRLGPFQALDEQHGRGYLGPQGGLKAVDLLTGRRLWARDEPPCAQPDVVALPKTGQIWLAGYEPPFLAAFAKHTSDSVLPSQGVSEPLLDPSQPGTGYVCLINGKNGKMLRVIKLPHVFGITVRFADGPAGIIAIATEDAMGWGLHAANVSTGRFVHDLPFGYDPNGPIVTVAPKTGVMYYLSAYDSGPGRDTTVSVIDPRTWQSRVLGRVYSVYQIALDQRTRRVFVAQGVKQGEGAVTVLRAAG